MNCFTRRVILWGPVFLFLLPVLRSETDCEGAFFERAEERYAARDYTAAIDLYSLQLAESGLTACSTYIYFRLGRINNRLSKFPDALECYKKALGLSMQDDSLVMCRILSEMAEVYSKTGEFEEAYRREMEALNIATSLEDTLGMSRSHYQLGGFALILRRYEEALEHYLSVRQLIASQPVGPKHASLWGAIGVTYMEMDRPDLAVKFLEASAEYATNLQQDEILAYTIGNLAVAYMKNNEFEAAESYFKQSLSRKEHLNDRTGLVGSKLEYSNFLILQHRFNEAENQLKEAISIAEEISARNKLLEGYQHLTTLFKETGDFEQALMYLEKATLLKDEIFNEETLSRIENIKAQYEIKNKELEIQRLHELQEQKEINYQLKKTGVFIAFSIMFLVFLYGLHMTNELQKRNTRLEESGNQLAAKNEELRNFAYVASHDLKEPLRTINSFAGLLRRKYIEKLDDRAIDYMNYISEGIHRMKDLLDDLLDYSRVDHTDENMEVVDSGELIRSAIGQLNAQIEKKHAQVIFSTDAFPKLEVVPSQFIQLFQNLVGNAIKFSNGNDPEVNIHCEKAWHNVYRFSVQDNGIGIAPEHRERIFEMFTRLHNRQEYEGTGIGLATCRKIVEKYGGKIWVESSPGKGATFFFTLPESVAEEAIKL
jgi:signal transduction histidine kinase